MYVSVPLGLAIAPVLVGASDELKKEYLGRLTADPLQAAYCVTEVCPARFPSCPHAA